MWHHQLHTPHDVYYAFQDDLFDEALQDTIRRNGTFAGWGDPCLLDIVATWLGLEDNILWVPSYDILMASMILIIDAWLEGDKRRLDQSPLWPDPDTNEARVVANLLPKTAEGIHYEHDLEVGIAHQLFSRSAFDSQRSIAKQNQLSTIRQQLEKLLPPQHAK